MKKKLSPEKLEQVKEAMGTIHAVFYSTGNFVESYHFTVRLREEDKANIIAWIHPNHFTPKDYRTIHLMSS